MSRHIALALAFVFYFVSVAGVQAETEGVLLSTYDILQENKIYQGDLSNVHPLETVQEFLSREDVAFELLKRGIDPIEAKNRVSLLTPPELDMLSKQIKEHKAGGDFGLGGIIGVAVFLFLVLLITDILGFTKVFSFTRSMRK